VPQSPKFKGFLTLFILTVGVVESCGVVCGWNLVLVCCRHCPVCCLPPQEVYWEVQYLEGPMAHQRAPRRFWGVSSLCVVCLCGRLVSA
jgi:hypothetical protein